MALNDTIFKVTERIVDRSKPARGAYLDKIARAADDGVKRAHLSCGNQAHAYAAMGDDKDALVAERAATAPPYARPGLVETHAALVELAGQAPTYNFDAGLLVGEIGGLLARAAEASERANV